MVEQTLTGDCALVATDLSSRSGCAAHWGRQVARRLDLSVVVVHVVEFEEQAGPDDDGESVRREPVDQRYRYTLRDWYRRQVGEEPPAVVLTVGSPAERLARVADEFDAGLIIVSASEKGRLRQLTLGSTALELTRAPPRPVAVVHPDHQTLPEEGTVVAGTDLAADSDPATELAGDLAGALSWPLHLLHASRLDNRFFREEFLPEPLRHWATARRRGRAMREEIERCGEALENLELHPRIVDDLPVRGLCRYIRRVDADIAVFGHHPRRGYGSSVLTSVAVRCLQSVQATIVIVPVGESPLV